MMDSIVRVRKTSHGARFLTIPKAFMDRIGDARFMVAEVDENGNIIYKPLMEV